MLIGFKPFVYILILLLSICSNVAAKEYVNAEYFVYSLGYRVGGPKGQNILELGIIEPCGGGKCIRSAQYKGSHNTSIMKTEYVHDMRSGRKKNCVDGNVGKVPASQLSSNKVAIESDDNRLIIKNNYFTHVWLKDSNAANGYVLSDISYKQSDVGIDQVVGFAFHSNSYNPDRIDYHKISYKYNGDIHHKDYYAQVTDEWKHAKSNIDFRPYSISSDGLVMHLTKIGHPEVIKKYGKNLWQHSSIILKPDMNIVYAMIQEYGHDFNMNNCFDEPGHNKFLLPVFDDGKNINAFVYIEYTPNKSSGSPMISVGRYYL